METSLTWLERLVKSPGDPEWERLLSVYGPLVSSWLTYAGVPKADHDDLVQDVLIVVVRRVNKFEHKRVGAFRAWLRQILANHLKQYFRTHARMACRFPLPEISIEDSRIARLLDRDHDEFLARNALAMAQADFSPETWQAFSDQVLSQLPPKEVAVKLGMSVNAVIKAKARVLARLRQELNRLA